MQDIYAAVNTAQADEFTLMLARWFGRREVIEGPNGAAIVCARYAGKLYKISEVPNE